jgi:hypothetical protein
MASQSHDIFADDASFTADTALSKHQAVTVGTLKGHVTAVTVADTGIGVAAASCASGDTVRVILFGTAIQVLADGTSAIAVGDPLHVNASGNFVKQTVGLAFTAVALEDLASGLAYIEVMSINGTAATQSAMLAMTVDTAAGLAIGDPVMLGTLAGHVDLYAAASEKILFGHAQTAGAQNAKINVMPVGPIGLAKVYGTVAVGDTLAEGSTNSYLVVSDAVTAGAIMAIAMTGHTGSTDTTVLTVEFLGVGAQTAS